MNIFVLSFSTKRAAISHCDEHVKKMVVEYAQIICTNLSLVGIGVPYKPTHVNHPATKWARKSSDNFMYLSELFLHLSDEYIHRRGKENLSTTKCHMFATREYANCFNTRIGLTPFAQCMPWVFREPDPIKAYQNFYCYDKSRFATWTKRKPPEWYRDKRKDLGML